jgi:hypothetical protein
VYSFGCNLYGNLGIGSYSNKNLPQKINFENNEQITNIYSSHLCDAAFFYTSLKTFFNLKNYFKKF